MNVGMDLARIGEKSGSRAANFNQILKTAPAFCGIIRLIWRNGSESVYYSAEKGGSGMDLAQKAARLSAAAGVSVGQAQSALTASRGDLLDALYILEKVGIIPSAEIGSYSTAEGMKPLPPKKVQPAAEEEPVQKRRRPVRDWLRRCGQWLVNNRLEAYRANGQEFQCPIVVLLGLIMIAWYAVPLIFIGGIFLGWRFRLGGPQLGRKHINGVVSYLDDLAEHVVEEVRGQFNRRKRN